MDKHILFVCDQPKTAWLDLLRSAVGSLASVDSATEKNAPVQLKDRSYDLVILETLERDDPGEAVARLRASQGDARILVLSSSPTWLRARHALLAGAVDYGVKTNDPEDLRKKIESALQIPQLANPRR